jgi:hypothetical protein
MLIERAGAAPDSFGAKTSMLHNLRSKNMNEYKHFFQGYNGQAVVSKEQIILGAGVTQEENDLYQLEPMIHETQESLHGPRIEKSIDTCTAYTG